MTDISFRKILGLNQQTYQRLKVCMSLNLRRQVFVAVCDDLLLRDRLATQLQTELNKSHSPAAQTPGVRSIAPGTGKDKAAPSPQTYPRLVSLHLNLNDPNPIVQIAQWLTQFPPPQRGQHTPLPAFQILGVEQLTRQPAVIQRLFFTHLQSIERNLPLLESCLVLWVTQPWFHALPQSAPEFWQCRTAVFEFVGEPTPLSVTSPEQISVPPLRQPSDSSQKAPDGEAEAAIAPPPNPTLTPAPSASKSELAAAQENPWDSLAEELIQWYESDAEGSNLPQQDPFDEEDLLNIPWEEDNDVHEEGSLLQQLQEPLEEPPPTLQRPITQEPLDDLDQPLETSQPLQQLSIGEPLDEPLEASRDSSRLSIARELLKQPPDPSEPPNIPQSLAESELALAAEAESTAVNGLSQPPPAAPTAGVKAAIEEPLPASHAFQEELQNLPIMQQIELLHNQQAPAEVLADAYRSLGNLYRDRIERGEASAENLAVAIQAYEQTLLWLPESSAQWVDVLNDLGNLYWMLSRTMPDPNEAVPYLQLGIQAYQVALSKIQPEPEGQTYPMVQNNLGAAYADLARYQDPSQNLQLSAQAYREALRYRTAESDPIRYASTQNNLGTTFWNLAQHQQSDANLRQAIAAYSEALRYYDPKQEPLNYAMIQNNLGTAYWNLAQYERPTDWLMLSLSAYRTALKYRTLETAPVAFAATQNNLGTAFWHLANHTNNTADRLDYLRQAIAAYETTLQAAEKVSQGQPPALLNFDLFATHNNLGLAHYQIATDIQAGLDSNTQSAHLENALKHHIIALQGWQPKSELRQTALNCVVQSMRAFYSQLGLAGQSLALSLIPGQLLPEILPKL